MIFLHIGRNKAGSTSLQTTFAGLHREMAERGIDYLNFGHLAHSDPAIAGYPTAEGLAAHARRTGRSLLVSNEFMFPWPRAYTMAVADALSGLPVTVLAWLRSYRDWLPSLYSEEVKRGDTVLDIDAYAAAKADQISAWPMLRDWGEAFGWRSLRIRTLEPSGLHGGVLITDALHAIGAGPPADEADRAPRANPSPGWIELELTRAARGLFDDVAWQAEGRAAVAALAAFLPDRGPPPGAARYLSPGMVRSLDALYADDLARLEASTGVALARSKDRPVGRRGGAPSLKAADAETLGTLSKCAEDMSLQPAVRRLAAALRSGPP